MCIYKLNRMSTTSELCNFYSRYNYKQHTKVPILLSVFTRTHTHTPGYSIHYLVGAHVTLAIDFPIDTVELQRFLLRLMLPVYKNILCDAQLITKGDLPLAN